MKLLAVEQYYLSNPLNIQRVLEDTELSLDELESMLGRFNANSHRHGQLRGKVVVHEDMYGDTVYQVRHHFTGKLYWSSND